MKTMIEQTLESVRRERDALKAENARLRVEVEQAAAIMAHRAEEAECLLPPNGSMKPQDYQARADYFRRFERRFRAALTGRDSE